MTLSTLANKKTVHKFYLHKFYFQNRIMPYIGITLFCVLFAYIYSLFSHGVTSPYMSYMFLYPLILGVVVGILCMIFKKNVSQYFFATHFYHTGVAALLLSSMLRGIFDIAGTASIYQTILMAIGIFSIFCGIVSFIIKK